MTTCFTSAVCQQWTTCHTDEPWSHNTPKFGCSTHARPAATALRSRYFYQSYNLINETFNEVREENGELLYRIAANGDKMRSKNSTRYVEFNCTEIHLHAWKHCTGFGGMYSLCPHGSAVGPYALLGAASGVTSGGAGSRPGWHHPERKRWHPNEIVIFCGCIYKNMHWNGGDGVSDDGSL